jgi:iron complex transport system ATP-binding protein
VEDVVSHALTLAGAARLAERDVTTLSGGEYARVQFARALAISHDCTLAARYADRLVLLADGKIVATGTADEVIRSDLLEQCYGVKVDILHDPNRGGVLVVPSEQSTAAVNSTSFPT